MATYGRTMRRGLPRRSGGDPWPPVDAVPGGLNADATDEHGAPANAVTGEGSRADKTMTTTEAAAGAPPSSLNEAPVDETHAAFQIEEAAVAPEVPAEPATPVGQTANSRIRRGLPRVAGGEPWPPVGDLPASGPMAAATRSAGDTARASAPVAQSVEHTGAAAAAAPVSEPVRGSEPGSTAPPSAAAEATTESTQVLRRGLPRVVGGDPWPTGTAVVVKPQAAPAAASAAESHPQRSVEPDRQAELQQEKSAKPDDSAEPELQPVQSAEQRARAEGASAAPPPAQATPTGLASMQATPAASARQDKPAASRTAKASSRTTRLLVGVLGLLAVALAAVFFTRWLVTLGFMQDFLATYPGETELPAGAEPGFPAWVQWQHFFNFFLIVLIIRSGLQVRRETRPPGYWTPKWSKGGDGKISINLWFHQTLDVLWLLNGLVFVVLLFITGHWVRLVPTTWEVFPNALSALIQYISLDWPTENGWVNYNSLQMLAYFVTVFIAAPLAAVSGARMSGLWPKDAKALNRAYPVEWARAIHFPVMLYFVVFIIGHVALVFATGALRNLNHMYGGQDAVNWAGFWIFFVSVLLVAGAWVAARPVVLAPLAGLTGRVSSR